MELRKFSFNRVLLRDACAAMRAICMFTETHVSHRQAPSLCLPVGAHTTHTQKKEKTTVEAA